MLLCNIRKAFRAFSSAAKVVFLTSFMTFLLASPVLAGSPGVACLPFDKRASNEQLDALRHNPSGFLEQIQASDAKVKATIANYLATDPSLLPYIKVLVSDAPSSIHHAIGEGLGIAMLLCSETQPKETRKILDFVHNLGNFAITSGFASINEAGAGMQLQQRSTPSQTNTLMTGKDKIELLDPFASIPVPE